MVHDSKNKVIFHLRVFRHTVGTEQSPCRCHMSTVQHVWNNKKLNITIRITHSLAVQWNYQWLVLFSSQVLHVLLVSKLFPINRKVNCMVHCNNIWKITARCSMHTCERLKSISRHFLICKFIRNHYLIRKSPDALDQVLVRLSITSDKLSNSRNDRKGIVIIAANTDPTSSKLDRNISKTPIHFSWLHL